MKIALVVPGFSAGPDDWCIPALTNLAASLAARPGVEVHVFSLRYPGQARTYQRGGATIHALGGAAVRGRRVRGVSGALLWTLFVAALRQEAARAPFDLVHGFWATESGCLAAAAARLLRVPGIVHLAGGELTFDARTGYGNAGPGLTRLLVGLSLRLATLITVPSSPMGSALRARYPSRARKATAWSFGVDTLRFQPGAGRQPRAEGRLALLQVASLIPVKDQGLLLRGLARARDAAPDRAISVTIAGRGPEAAALAAEAGALGLGSGVRLIGEQDHGRLAAVYRAHDAFVLTSRHEAQCMAVLEAGACGLPWIGPAVGAVADLAEDPNCSGWLVPAGNAAALGAAILDATDSDLRAQRGTVARALVERNYCLETQTTRLLDLYREALRLPTGRSAGKQRVAVAPAAGGAGPAPLPAGGRVVRDT